MADFERIGQVTPVSVQRLSITLTRAPVSETPPVVPDASPYRATYNIDVTSGVSPCDANGDIYWATTGDLDRVYIQIYGYWI